MTPRVSVVVPSYCRPALLDRCLAALGRQQLPASDYEIIVVHDGPSADARQLVERRADDLPDGPLLHYFEPPHGGPAAARNLGSRNAAGTIIAFTDDDTVPEPDWLVRGLAAFAPDVDALWGRVLVPLRENPTDYEIDAARLSLAQFATANCFCRKSVLEAVGGFDERFALAWREDADLYFRLLKRNARVVHVPEAVVVHPVRPAPWGVSLWQQRKILYDALLFKKHRFLYRQRIRPTPRWDYYAIVATLILTIVSAVAGAMPLALLAASLWIALTARFCLSRLKPAAKRASHVVEMIVTSTLVPPLAVFWRLVGAFRFRVVFL